MHREGYCEFGCCGSDPERFIVSFTMAGIRVNSDSLTAEDVADVAVDLSSKGVPFNVKKA